MTLKVALTNNINTKEALILGTWGCKINYPETVLLARFGRD
jgi:hypothetical protein